MTVLPGETVDSEACRTGLHGLCVGCPCTCHPHKGRHCRGACTCHGNSGYVPQTGMGSPSSSPVYREVA